MAHEKNVFGRMRQAVGELTDTAHEIADLNREETENFENSKILEEIQEDEEEIEHFTRNLEKLDEEINELITQKKEEVTQDLDEIDPELREQLWHDLLDISEEARQLSERYSHLPEHVAQAAVHNDDPETASHALVYFTKIEHVLDITEELCKAETKELHLDSVINADKPVQKLKRERQKLKKEKQEIQTKKREHKVKLRTEGLVEG